MKNKSILHLALLRKALLCFSFLALTFQTHAQTGTTCISALSFAPEVDGIPIAETQANQTQWYSFVADNTTLELSIYEIMPTAAKKLRSAAIFGGSCSSPSLIALDSATSSGDSLLVINTSTLVTGNTYYVRIEKYPSATSAASYLVGFNYSLATACIGCHDLAANNCNLVCNGDFEYNDGIPSTLSQTVLACPWQDGSTLGTSDYFHSSSPAAVDIPSNSRGYQAARSGNAYGGFVAYGTGTYWVPGYHEYLLQPLKCSLIYGQTYELTFYVNLSGKSNYSVNSIGACFLPSGSSGAPIPFTGSGQYVIPLGTKRVINTSGFLNDTSTWVAITGTFNANGNEAYIMIGDFGSSNPANVQTEIPLPVPAGTQNYIAYYFVEDVSLTPVNTLTISASEYSVCPWQDVVMESNLNIDLDWTPAAYLDCTHCKSPIGSFPNSNTVSATITYCSGCSYTATADIEVVNLFANAGPDVTICPESGGTDLTATGAGDVGTYLWSTGETTATIHVYPSVTTSYTVTVTGCGTTHTDVVTVTVANPTTTATASPVIIPSGCSSILSATSSMGGLTYTWMPESLGGSSVLASPASTTTYTVTGNSADGGCYSTATVTVQVLSSPFTVNGSTSACAGLSAYSVSSVIPGVTYTWSTSTGLSGTGTTANIDFNLTGGGTITFTADFGSGCTYSASLLVGACCDAGGGLPAFYNTVSSVALAPYGTVSSGYLMVVNQTFAINGTFVVDQNLILKGCDLRMGYLAQIVLKPGVTLKITSNGTTDKTHIYACNEMWDGIYVTDPTETLIIDKGTTIEDGINAVVSANLGVLQISSSGVFGDVIFNKNHRSIVVEAALGATHPASIKNVTIQCYDGVVGGNPAVTLNKLHIPYAGQRSEVGCDITDVKDILIGDPSAAGYLNTFDNLDFGIRGYNSGITVYNNNFKNITAATPPPPKKDCNAGTAICVTGNPTVGVANSVIIGDVTASAYINTFTNCQMGVVANQNLNLLIVKNTFTSIVSTAVRAAKNYQCGIVISENTITTTKLGVDCYDNRATKVQITKNDIDAGTVTQAGGVLAQELVTGSNTYTISDNTIRNVRNGVAGSGLYKSYIQRNNVYLKHTTSSTQYCRGIRLQGSSFCEISANWIKGQNTSDWWIEGISVDVSYSDKVFCNESHDMFTGMFFGGVQTPNTRIGKNEMNNNYRGLVLNYGEVGPQKTVIATVDNPNDNKWVGSFALHTDSWFSTGSTSPFYVRTATGIYNPSPYLNYAFPPFPTNLVPISPIAGNLNSLACPLIIGPPVPDTGSAPPLPLMLQIAGDSITSPVYDTASRWMLKQSLYKYLKHDSSAASLAPELEQFQDENTDEELGKLDRVETALAEPATTTTADLSNAKAENTTIVATSDAAANSKLVNNVLIDNAIAGSDYSDEQLNELRLLAAKCPYNDGIAVYQARVILSQFEDTEYSNECEFTPVRSERNMLTEQSTDEVQRMFNLYPNPNNGTMNFIYSLDEGSTGEFFLFDLTGKQINVFKLHSGKNNVLLIEEKELNNGMYFYNIKIDGMLKTNGKILIIK